MIYFSSTRKIDEQAVVRVKSKVTDNCQVIFEENDGSKSLTWLYQSVLNRFPDEIIIFAHDDINVTTSEPLDLVVQRLFDTSDFGIIGVAGSTSLAENGVWWHNKADLCGVVEHQQKDVGKVRNYFSRYSAKHSYVMPVAVVDGVLFAVHPNRIKANFNTNIPGFHFYDVSFCADNFIKDTKIGVTTDIAIHHKSIGKLSQAWEENRQLFLSKYGSSLPLKIIPPLATLLPAPVISPQSVTPIAVVILTKNNFEITKTCILSFLRYSSNKYTIYLGDTGSDEENVKLYQQLADTHQSIQYIHIGPYNFAKNNNDIIHSYVKEDIIILSNNDIELMSDVPSAMLHQLQSDKNCGTVGCKLLYPDGRIQHGGIHIYLDKQNAVQLTHYGIHTWYGAEDVIKKTPYGCTGALLGFRKKDFIAAAGLPSTQECFEDVLLNLAMTVRGKTNYYLGNVFAVHHESTTRKKNPDMLKNLNLDYQNHVVPFFKKWHRKFNLQRVG